MALLFSFILFSLTLLGSVTIVRLLNQRDHDRDRKTYRLTFPNDLEAERVQAWVRSISGTLRIGPMRILGVPTVAFEMWASPAGISHRIKVPWQHADYVVTQLRSLVPGIRVTPEDDWPVHEWTRAVEVGLTNSARTLRIANAADLATSLLASVQALNKGESVILQWVVSPAIPQHKPVHAVSKSHEPKYRNLLRGDLASRDEVEERRKKLDEPNLLAVLRVAAKASTPDRADHLIYRVKASLAAVRGPSTRFQKRLASQKQLMERVRHASGSVTFPMQLSTSELTALVAWPLGNPFVAGLPTALTKQLPATEAVPRQGRILGMSNFAGQERPVAIGYKEALMHMHVIGPTGVGKSALLANMIKQDMEQGFGAILLEAKGDLFRSALDYVPRDRLNDVIVLDVNDSTNPVGFNVLRQGDPAVVVDELNMIFNQLFKDNPSLWMQELMYHGLHTLAEDSDATFTDLASLVNPDESERDWRDALIASVRDPQLKRFWRRFDSQPKARQEQIVQPVLSRVWPMSRTKLLNIVGQSSSSFLMDDVIRNNKILLVNLSGVEREAASLMGTLIMNAVWNSVKRTRSDKPTFMYLDEAHHYMNLPMDIGMMLVEARSMGLGLVLAHQHLDQLTPEMRAALRSSARTKVVFQTVGGDARELAKALGGQVEERDVANLPIFEAIARIATPGGMASALTMSTLPPARPSGTSADALRASRTTYGRDVHAVRDAIMQRRQTVKPSAARRPRISGTWNDPPIQ